jgi:hypothetical protein
MDGSCTTLIAPGLIDTKLKLRLMLLFYEHPRWSGTLAQLNEWLRESPWAIHDAVEALVDAGLLGCMLARPDTTIYRLELTSEQWAFLNQLAHCFADPLRRDDIYRQVRSADAERQFRNCTLQDQYAAPLFQLAW